MHALDVDGEMMSDPYLPFFVADWLSDDDLDGLQDIAAVGLWIEMLSRMQKAGGRFVLGGDPVSMTNGPALIAKHVRCIKNAKEAAALLDQLYRRNIFSLDDDGFIYSRRIVRDAERRQQAREYGRRGGNPRITGGGKPPTDNPPGVNPPTLNPPGDIPILFQSSPVQSNPDITDTHNARANEPVVDMTEFDADPEPDRRGILPEPTQISGVAFAKWFTERGIEAGAIPGQHFLAPLEYGRVNGGIEVANKLLAAYGLAECEARAAQLFALVVASKGALKNPRIQWLLDRWHNLATDAPVVPGKHSDATQRQLEIVAAIQSRRGQTA